LNKDQTLKKRDEKFEVKVFDYIVPPLWHKFKELYEVKYELSEDGTVVPHDEHAVARQNLQPMLTDHPKTNQESLNMFLLNELGFAFKLETFQKAQEEAIAFLDEYPFKNEFVETGSSMTWEEYYKR
jgi:ATP:corrinoid adenosyltransferase